MLCRPEVNATSLSFFLVMPVQRIARYPLLLQTIQKHTRASHPAYSLLERTAHTSIALNCRINEYKRFREVGASPSCFFSLLPLSQGCSLRRS